MIASKKYSDKKPAKTFIQNVNNIDHIKPHPIDREIELDPKKSLTSKTDATGIIEYSNDYFVQINGYKESELVGRAQNIIRHPDMPKIIFKRMWNRLENRQNISALVKNLAKDGSYYWVLTDFEIKVDKETDEINSYISHRRAAPRSAIAQIEKLYKKLVEIEKQRGIEGSEKYLIGFLEERGQSYDAYIDEITENGGAIKRLIKTVQGLFTSKNDDKRDLSYCSR